MSSILAVRYIERLSTDQLSALITCANSLGINPDHLATVIGFESGFKTTAVNPHSGASGLIQFIRPTAERLGTTLEAIRSMGFVQQLGLVFSYFKNFGKLDTLEKVYLAVFYPAAIGWGDDHIIASSPSATYEQNKLFDADNKGYYTRRDITRAIRNYESTAVGQRIEVPELNYSGAPQSPKA